MYTPWIVQPRLIPLPTETPVKVDTVRYADSDLSVEAWLDLFQNGKSLKLVPGTTHRIELEAECHSTAFLRFTAEQATGGSSEVTITYSEGYEKKPEGDGKYDPSLPRVKSDRLQREGNYLIGPTDTFVFTGGEGEEEETYEPFWWRTFRFLVLEIKVGEKPLTLRGLEAKQTNYPTEVKAKLNFGKADDEVHRIWDVSLRTMRNCLFDGFSDCPFYEQLQ